MNEKAPGVQEMTDLLESMSHRHSWTFLRQEEENVGFDRNPTWHIFDVYFCAECLAYRRVHVRTEEPSRELYSSGTRLVMWRLT